MLKSVTITNYRGESVVYKIEGVDVNDNNGLLITNIDGLGPVKADINMTKLVTSDGSIFNSARLEPRNIVIEARFTNATSIEDARQLSYKFFPIKKQVTIRVETDNRIAETTGYVESNEPNIFSEESDVQISILCESAFFYSPDKDVTTFSGVEAKFEFVYENAYSEVVEETYEERYINFRGIIESTPYFVHGYNEQGQETWIIGDENIGKVKINRGGYSPVTYDVKSITITNRKNGAATLLCTDGTQNNDTLDGDERWFTYTLTIPATQKTESFGFTSEGVLTFDMLVSIPCLNHSYDSEADDHWTVAPGHEGEVKFTTDLSSSRLYTLASIELTDPDNEAYKFTSTSGDVFENITSNVDEVGFYVLKRELVPGIDKQTNFGDIIFKKVASVTYTGDSEVGCIIELHAIGTATNVTVYNMYTRERMRIDTDKIAALTGKGIVAGDTITICTIVGKKSITLLREGININILNALSKNTDWITLTKGDNVLGITADYGDQNIQFTVTSQVAYEGV